MGGSLATKREVRERERACEELKERLTAIPIPKRHTLHPSGLTQHVDQPLHKEVHDQDEFPQCKNSLLCLLHDKDKQMDIHTKWIIMRKEQKTLN